MREIKFRALSTNNKDWIYGFPLIYGWADVFQIVDCHGERKNVKPNTFCQFTGLKDKNGVEIYEGDILKRVVTIRLFGTSDPPEDVEDIQEVKWREDYAGFYIGERELFAEIDATSCFYTGCGCTKFEIIGNIHERPELLEVQP
ncbi:YopX family protein [Sporosarcina sp. FSL K6-3508]|uniref:YopX family protein n=1 Tax=Sporosarcina sp. FSL K6-3508 TaxID=2921557 RepID=UPI00315A6FF7